MTKIVRFFSLLFTVWEQGGLASSDPEVNTLASRMRDREFGFHAPSQ